jgi:hypothetical protein
MSITSRRRFAIAASVALSLTVLAAPAVFAKQDAETVWANGQEWTMIAPTAVPNPNPNLLASAPPFYVLAFPPDPTDPGHFILPSNYAPQCDPCLGVPVPPYHDHLLTGAPGYGTAGTAGDYEGPWRVVLMVWNPAFVRGGDFAPVTSDEDLPAAIAAGEFQSFPGTGGFEKPLPVVLICPLVAPAAAG